MTFSPIFMRRILFMVMLGSAVVTNAQNDAPLASPKGGWNYSGMTDRSADTSVSYPLSPIDRGAQRNRALIKGRIEAAGKNRVPKLVVNGNPLPLNTDAEGRYARHYAFGGGSNGVELKTADGKSVKRVQFYEANPHQQLPKLRIICSWDAPEAEVDLHVLTPDAQHVTWSSPILSNGGGLDVDSVDGPGPEMFSTSAPLHGVYNVYINYWGNLSEAGYNFDQSQLQKPIITTRITLVFNENTPSERREDFVVPLRKIGELNFIKSFVY